MKHTAFALLLILFFTVPIGARAECPNDTDCDGVPDEVESRLLSSFAPVWASPELGHRSPLPLDWAVRHCRLHWYESNSTSARKIGDTGDTSLTPTLVLDLVNAFRSSGRSYHFRLAFKEARFRDGNDPSEPMHWEDVQARGVGLYGRVNFLPGQTNHYFVQYFAYFGWNETDTPPACDAGNHEGDWVCIELDVDGTNLERPQIVQAILHNHGRQIFVQSPSVFEFNGSHPVLYPERGTQELWPYSEVQGFLEGTVPPNVSVNKTFGEYENDATAPGGYSVVRQHNGAGGRYFIASVVNVGEQNHPYVNGEARFFQEFDGWYGNEWADECYFGLLDIPTEPPSGPAFQEKMWARTFSRILVWPPQTIVHVNFAYFGIERGTETQPFILLQTGISAVAPGGSIVVHGGSSNERLNISQPCTITSVGGATTIGTP